MSKKLKSILSTVLKVSIAFGLVAWLVNSGRLDLSLLSRLLSPPLAFSVLALAFVPVVINNYRWQILMQNQKLPCRLQDSLPLTFIGLFFNYAMPGGVGGDVIKGYYLVQDHKEQRLAAATSILMDRLVGFYVMTFLGAVALLFDITEILKRPAMITMTLIILGLFSGFTTFFSICFSRRVSNHPAIAWIFRKAPGGEKLKKMYDVVHTYRRDLPSFFKACGLSVVSQISMILFFIWVGNLMGGEAIPWQTYALVVPVGLITTAMPISIAGVGVGQVVFMKLFNWNLGYDTPVAPAVITAYQIALFAWGLFGVYFFLKRKRPEQLSEAPSEI